MDAHRQLVQQRAQAVEQRRAEAEVRRFLRLPANQRALLTAAGLNAVLERDSNAKPGAVALGRAQRGALSATQTLAALARQRCV
jgi:hypothetical protein